MSIDSAAAGSATSAFGDLGLSEPVLKALADVGYESPSPIQAETIPHLLAGKDLVGQAQTGTGKTAAFALPVLSGLSPDVSAVQTLVLVPTRELAIQVAEAFRKYAAHMPGFHVLPIYGGQSYEPQLARLRRGVHVVVGTPGRVMDHMKRGTLNLGSLRHLVLDEADEMLRMGFIDDVEWVLEQTPAGRQVALFSATMPPPIRKIAQRHLKSPVEVTIRDRTSTATNIRQRYFLLGGMTKLDALTRILEAEPFDGMLIFARTKQSTAELSERLEARGYAAAPLNGDIPQALRERTVARLKSGQLDIVVATDVAARGLDVDRISHVVNFDIPYDTESYVHRIGRTGRAGRSGEAILFVTYRERNMLRLIERATRQPIERMELPTLQAVSDLRIARFMERITAARADTRLSQYQHLVERYALEHEVPPAEVAAALAVLVQADKPLFVDDEYGSQPAPVPPVARAAAVAPTEPVPAREERSVAMPPPPRAAESPAVADDTATIEAGRPGPTAPAALEARERRRAERPERPERSERSERQHRPERTERSNREPPPGRSERPRRDKGGEPRMERYRIEVGSIHRVKPANIVGAIINEAGLDGNLVGQIDIREDHSFVDLPEGMPKEIFRDLQKVWVAGQQLRISRADAPGRDVPPPRREGSGPRRAGPAPRREGFSPRREGSAPRREGSSRGRPPQGDRPVRPGDRPKSFRKPSGRPFRGR